MPTPWITITAAVLLVGLALAAAVCSWWWRSGSPRDQRMRRRLAIGHEQFLAEQRLQHLTQHALQQMLDAGRNPGSSSASSHEGWYRP